MPPPPPPPPPPSGSDPESFEPPPPPESAAQGSEPMRGWATTDIGESVELAGAGGRLLARIVDMIVVGLPAVIVAGVVIGQPDDATEVSAGTSLAVTAIWLIYEVSMIALRGQTLGKMATRIKVVRAENSGPPEWSHSFSRWAPVGVCSIISAWVPIIGLLSLLIYLSLVWDRKRQGWHDKAGKTLVIKT